MATRLVRRPSAASKELVMFVSRDPQETAYPVSVEQLVKDRGMNASVGSENYMSRVSRQPPQKVPFPRMSDVLVTTNCPRTEPICPRKIPVLLKSEVRHATSTTQMALMPRVVVVAHEDDVGWRSCRIWWSEGCSLSTQASGRGATQSGLEVLRTGKRRRFWGDVHGDGDGRKSRQLPMTIEGRTLS